jgi:hypothetical protein
MVLPGEGSRMVASKGEGGQGEETFPLFDRRDAVFE